jgi:hypothetical protein
VLYPSHSEIPLYALHNWEQRRANPEVEYGLVVALQPASPAPAEQDVQDSLVDSLPPLILDLA